ncbi:MAG: C-terminal binding protein [bacterium]
MARVVVTDYTFPSLLIEEEILLPQGFSLEGGQFRSVESLIPFVAGADAVITQFAPINADVIAAMQNAKVIVRYGIGVDNVDLEAARFRGIPVCNVPDYCIDEVADHTLAFILSVTRQVVPNTLHIRDGRWGLAPSLDAMRTLRDQTVGIVGFGRIGREVAARLAPLKCQRLVIDPVIAPESIVAAGCEPVSIEEILERSDIITLHCPSNATTRKMFNENSISRMKRGAILVNLARGDLVDTESLVNALESGQISSAAIDVCDPEPIPLESPLRRLPQVVCASHVASASPRAVRTLRETAAKLAAAALRGENLPNVVNGL